MVFTTILVGRNDHVTQLVAWTFSCPDPTYMPLGRESGIGMLGLAEALELVCKLKKS